MKKDGKAVHFYKVHFTSLLIQLEQQWLGKHTPSSPSSFFSQSHFLTFHVRLGPSILTFCARARSQNWLHSRLTFYSSFLLSRLPRTALSSVDLTSCKAHFLHYSLPRVNHNRVVDIENHWFDFILGWELDQIKWNERRYTREFRCCSHRFFFSPCGKFVSSDIILNTLKESVYRVRVKREWEKTGYL